MSEPPPKTLTSQEKDAFTRAQRPGVPRMSDKACVREVLPDIHRKIQAGWSYEEVRQEMAKTLGFKGTLKTLYQYVWQLSTAQTPAPPAPAPSMPRPVTPEVSGGANRSPPPPDPAASRASRTAPAVGGCSYIQNLRGPLAGTACEASRQETKHGSLVDKLNKPL